MYLSTCYSVVLHVCLSMLLYPLGKGVAEETLWFDCRTTESCISDLGYWQKHDPADWAAQNAGFSTDADL